MLSFQCASPRALRSPCLCGWRSRARWTRPHCDHTWPSSRAHCWSVSAHRIESGGGRASFWTGRRRQSCASPYRGHLKYEPFQTRSRDVFPNRIQCVRLLQSRPLAVSPAASRETLFHLRYTPKADKWPSFPVRRTWLKDFLYLFSPWPLLSRQAQYLWGRILPFSLPNFRHVDVFPHWLNRHIHIKTACLSIASLIV